MGMRREEWNQIMYEHTLYLYTYLTIKGKGIKQYNNVIVSFFFVHGVSGIVAMLAIALFCFIIYMR